MPTSTKHQGERRFLVSIVFWLFITLSLFALIHLLYPDSNAGVATISSTASPTVPATVSPGVAPAAATGVDDGSVSVFIDAQAAATARRVADEARALSRSRLQQLRHAGDDVLELTMDFEKECDRWQALASELLNDERGKQLATDVNAVQAYRSLTAVERPARGTANQVRSRVEELMQPIDAALDADDSAYMPSPGITEALESERRLLRQATDKYRRSCAQLEGMLAAAQGIAGNQTLGSVIQSLVAEEARIASSSIASAREEALREVREKLAEAEAEKVREIGRSEVDRVRAQQGAAKARLEADAALTREQGARDRLRQLASDPDIQAKFAPFLSAGVRYPGRYEGSVRWLERKPRGRTQPGPVSQREMKTGGVLDNLECFVAAVTSSKSRTGAQNDRPHWPLPTNRADWDRYRQDFELFQQLVPVWVEMQILPAE